MGVMMPEAESAAESVAHLLTGIGVPLKTPRIPAAAYSFLLLGRQDRARFPTFRAPSQRCAALFSCFKGRAAFCTYCTVGVLSLPRTEWHEGWRRRPEDGCPGLTENEGR